MRIELMAGTSDDSLVFPELVLLEKIRSKDIAAFEKFYKQSFKRQYITAFKYTRHHEISQEIVHDSFLKIWNNAPSLNITSSLENYLYRTVVNACINHIKKEKRELEKQQRFSIDFEEADEPDDAPARLENRLILIEYALDQLPPQCKKVMMMSKFQKCKQQEIADTLGISIKTVKNHLTYGFKKIRDLIAENNAFILLVMFYFSYRTFI